MPVSVDWGDGNFIFHSGTTISGISLGLVTVRSNNLVTRVRFSDPSIRHLNLVAVTTLTTLESLVNGCTSVETITIGATPSALSMRLAFRNTINLTTISFTDTSNITDFSQPFINTPSLLAITGLNTDSGINFQSMFAATVLAAIPNINTSAGQLFGTMFFNTPNLVCIPRVNTLNQIDTTSMFGNNPLLVAPNSAEQTTLLSGTNYINGSACP